MATRRKLSDEQIITVMKQLEAGRTAAEMAREVGVSTYTIYAWKAKYGGMEPSEAIKLRHVIEQDHRPVALLKPSPSESPGRKLSESIVLARAYKEKLDCAPVPDADFAQRCASQHRLPPRFM